MDNKMCQTIIDILIQKVTPYVIYIFGSTVKGTSNKFSDIDIAFLSENDIDEYDCFMMAQVIANSINKEVDLIDLKKASTVLQGQIISTGTMIYCLKDKKRIEFEMRALKMYAKLNEERKVILSRIQESGNVLNEE